MLCLALVQPWSAAALRRRGQGDEFDVSLSEREFTLALGDFGELVMLPKLMQTLEARNSDIGINTRSMTGIDVMKEMPATLLLRPFGYPKYLLAHLRMRAPTVGQLVQQQAIRLIRNKS